MADETPVTPTATPAPAAPQPDEGFLHSLATSIGVDPEAVVATAKAVRQHPWTVAKEVGSAQAGEFADAAHHLRETARSALTGVASAITNPEAKAKAFERMKSPGLVNKLQGAEEYASSIVPFIGGNIAKSEEQAGAGNLPGMAGTLTGTLAPLVTETEPIQGLKTHLEGTAKIFAESAKEELQRGVAATAPEGSSEAGFAKLGGKKVRPATPKPAAPVEPVETEPEKFAEVGGKFVGKTPEPVEKPYQAVEKTPETTAPVEKPYHPDLQKVIDLPGMEVHRDPSRLTNLQRGSFIAPDGQCISMPA